MKKVFYIIIFVLSMHSYAQEEGGNYAAVASEFRALYNGGDYTGIFNKFDVDMKKALPREKTIQFFTQNVNSVMGAITEMQFLKVKQGAHIYRTSFDRAVADILISLNNQNQINGLYISPAKANEAPKFERNTTKMSLPFKEEWFVFWGGTTVEKNYHVAHDDQKYAYDILMVKDGASHKGAADKNESYYVFGKEVLAPCDGRVVKVITGVKDNVPGELNPEQLTGNTIVLQTSNNEYVLFAHLKEASIVVEEGQEITKGELLGLCGNSGNSTEPHLHLSLQDHEDMLKSNGAKLYFDNILVNGELKNDYLPEKEDFIKNTEQ